MIYRDDFCKQLFNKCRVCNQSVNKSVVCDEPIQKQRYGAVVFFQKCLVTRQNITERHGIMVVAIVKNPIRSIPFVHPRWQKCDFVPVVCFRCALQSRPREIIRKIQRRFSVRLQKAVNRIHRTAIHTYFRQRPRYFKLVNHGDNLFFVCKAAERAVKFWVFENFRRCVGNAPVKVTFFDVVVNHLNFD